MADERRRTHPREAPARSRLIAFTTIWLVCALMWSVVARRAGAATIETIAVGVGSMGGAAILALVMWPVTAFVPWRPRRWSFIVFHLLGLALFAAAHTAMMGITLARGRPLWESIQETILSPAYGGWNLMMGASIYLSVGGIAYARRAEAALRDSQRQNAEAQLAALRAQIHPHFLFNALHTVGALIHQNPDRAERALDDLGRLLRYAVTPPDEDVSLRQEWNFAQEYLAFESLRLGARLRLETTIDPEALKIRVPPFILQPLIENAVRHGVAESTIGGNVAIHIARTGSVVTVVIRNSVLPDVAASPGMAGSGLRRLQELLELAYGRDDAHVEFANSPRNLS
jgi:hypothetical protein